MNKDCFMLELLICFLLLVVLFIALIIALKRVFLKEQVTFGENFLQAILAIINLGIILVLIQFIFKLLKS